MNISVLISVYNGDNPEHLSIALKSIMIDQSLKPKEVVIVCDGPISFDLKKVIDDFYESNKEYTKIVPLIENVGLGNALRIGVGYCSYDFIARMDADDISKPNRFETQVNYLTKNLDVDVVGSYFDEFISDVNDLNRKRVVPLKHNEIVKMSKHRSPMNHVTVMFRKRVFEKCNYLELKYLEDYYLWLRLIKSNFIFANIEQSLVYVRIGNGFETKRKSKQRINGWKELQKYMLKENMIGFHDAFFNMLSIYVFIYLPNSIRKYIYSELLRK